MVAGTKHASVQSSSFGVSFGQKKTKACSALLQFCFLFLLSMVNCGVIIGRALRSFIIYYAFDWIYIAQFWKECEKIVCVVNGDEGVVILCDR